MPYAAVNVFQKTKRHRLAFTDSTDGLGIMSGPMMALLTPSLMLYRHTRAPRSSLLRQGRTYPDRWRWLPECFQERVLAGAEEPQTIRFSRHRIHSSISKNDVAATGRVGQPGPRHRRSSL